MLVGAALGPFAKENVPVYVPMQEIMPEFVRDGENSACLRVGLVDIDAAILAVEGSGDALVLEICVVER